MKSIVFLLIVIAFGLTSCNIPFHKIWVVHNKFMQVGDYTFEVLSRPDEFGDIKVSVVNIKGNKFKCEELYNDYDVLKRDLSPFDDIASAYDFLKDQNEIVINRTSGLKIITADTIPVKEEKHLASEIISRLSDDYTHKGQVFVSASNFFNIR